MLLVESFLVLCLLNFFIFNSSCFSGSDSFSNSSFSAFKAANSASAWAAAAASTIFFCAAMATFSSFLTSYIYSTSFFWLVNSSFFDSSWFSTYYSFLCIFFEILFSRVIEFNKPLIRGCALSSPVLFSIISAIEWPFRIFLDPTKFWLLKFLLRLKLYSYLEVF